MPDNSMLLHFVATAAGVTALTCILCAWLQRVLGTYAAGIMAALGLSAAVIAGQYLDQGLSLPPERDWHYIAWIVTSAAFTLALLPFRSALNPLPALLMAAFAWAATGYLFPAANSDELFDQWRIWWSLAVPLSAFLNTYCLRRTSSANGQHWVGWILVAQYAAVCAALMMTYATLAAAAMGYWAFAIGVAIVGTLRVWLASPNTLADTKEQATWAKTTLGWQELAFAPLALAAVLFVASFRGYNYGMVPGWINVPLLFLPSIVCMLDWGLMQHRKSWQRVSLAASASAILALAPIIALSINASASEY